MTSGASCLQVYSPIVFEVSHILMAQSNGIALENMLPSRQFRISDSHIYPHASRDSIIIFDARGLIADVHFLSDEGLLIPDVALINEEGQQKYNSTEKVAADGRKLVENDVDEPPESNTPSN